jgi:glycosyltransferase involved in cell wall biosynthesis
VTIIGHTYAAAINHEKIAALAASDELVVQLVVPSVWKEPELRRVHRLAALPPSGYSVVRLRPLFQRGHNLFLLPPLALGRVVRTFDPDIIHLEEAPWTLVASQVALLARRLDKPLLLFTWENQDRRYPPPFGRLNSFVLRSSAAVIAGNEDGRGVLRGHGFTGSISVLPQLGVDPERFSPGDGSAMRRRLDVQGAFVVGFIGRLVHAKGVHVLLEAFRLLDDPGARLLVLGSGPLEEELLRKARALGIDDRVCWQRAMAHEEVVEALRAIDVLVLPSIGVPRWKEQFGHVLIEAMACEVAVVGSDSGEIPNVIQDAGLVFPEGDAGALAGCLRDVRGDVARRRHLAVRGRTRVIDRYTHRAVALRTSDIYREVLSTVR